MLMGTDGADEQILLSQPFSGQGCSQRQGLGASATPSSGQEGGQLPAGGGMGWCQHPLAAMHKDVQAMGLSGDPGMEGQCLWQQQSLPLGWHRFLMNDWIQVQVGKEMRHLS